MFANLDEGIRLRGHPRHGPFYRMRRESDDGVRHYEVMEEQKRERELQEYLDKQRARREAPRTEAQLRGYEKCRAVWDARWEAKHAAEHAAKLAEPHGRACGCQSCSDAAFALTQRLHKEACEEFLRQQALAVSS